MLQMFSSHKAQEYHSAFQGSHPKHSRTFPLLEMNIISITCNNGQAINDGKSQGGDIEEVEEVEEK